MNKLSKIKYHILIGFILLIFNSMNAQDYKRTAWWYFGNKVGLNFTDTNIVVDTNSKMDALEGCATISDTFGNLLFYTNGLTIWNKNHHIMEDGNGLNAHISSTQSSLILPIPKNDSMYLVFTTYPAPDGFTVGGLQYNIVNINENNGLGKVINKNQVIKRPISEKLTATKHSNGIDYWIITHGQKNNEFYSYLLNENGLIECPIISKIGKIYNDVQGYLKISPNGRIAVSCSYADLNVDVLLFNNSNGVFEKHIGNLYEFYPYGAEFSNDNNNIFISDRGKHIYQYKVNQLDIDSILKSKKTVFDSSVEVFDALQLASNGIIYTTLHNSKFIYEIKNSNNYNLSELIKSIEIKGSRIPKYGLPNHINSYFYQPKISFKYIQNCDNSTIEFKEKYNTSFSSITWNIYKDSSLIQSYSTSNPKHTFSDTGLYDVELIINSDTVKKQVLIESRIFEDSSFVSCNKDSFSIHIADNFRCINWSNGSEQKDTLIKQEGIYIVSAYNIQGCYVTDSLIVKFLNVNQPNIYQIEDTLYTDSIAGNYTWYKDNSLIAIGKEPKQKITDTGTYYLEIENEFGCKNQSEAIEIKCKTRQPNIRRNGDTLFTDSIATAYVWFNGNNFLTIGNIPKIQITDTGNYYVKTFNYVGCEDSSMIFTVDCKNTTIPNIRRIGRDSLLTDSTGLKYTWYRGNTEIPNSNNQIIKTIENEIYKVIIEHKFGCKTSSIDFNVNYLSINPLEKSNIKIYPNPTSNEIFIDGIETQTMIEIWDITGKKLIEKYIDKNENKIGLLDFGQGVYLLKIKNQTFKIMISK